MGDWQVHMLYCWIFENAYFYQQLFDVVKDTIYNAETDNKIKTMQFSYEMDKKEG